MNYHHQTPLTGLRAEPDAAKKFVELASLLLASKGMPTEARMRAQETGASRRVVSVLKAEPGSIAEAGGSPTTWGSDLSYDALSSSFLASLSNANAFDQALPFMRSIPLRTKVPVSSVAAQGYIVAEADAKTIGDLEFSQEALEPVKAAAVVVVSADLVKLGGTLASTLIERELRTGISRATDAKFVGDLVDATTPTASSGEFLYDLGVMLDAIEGDSSSRYFCAMEPANAKRLAVMPGVMAPRAYPEMTTSGGVIGGVQIVASDQLGSGEVVLFDASQIAADPGTVMLDATENACLDMAGGDTPTLSLWQKNLRGLRAERMFGFSILRPNAVASISGASYVAGSPA